MTVWCLWYGYEDIEGIFSSEAAALRCIEELMKSQPYRRRDNFSILEEIVRD